MRTILTLLAMVLAVPAPAQQARPMTTAEFLAKAEPLMKKSRVSLMFSAEAKRLMKEFGAAAEATRAAQDAAVAAGRKPATCLPPKGKAKVDARELITYLKNLPPAQKSLSFRAGFGNYAASKYPCPKA